MSFRFPSRLYAIADPGGRRDPDPVAIGVGLLEGGARLLQLRWKEAPTADLILAARELGRQARRRGALLIVNDRVDVAAAGQAHGAHLGQEDLPLTVARRQLPDRIIGISTHDVFQAAEAANGGADYIGFGPVFGTSTKETGYSARGLEALALVRARVSIPIVAIGGIRETLALPVLAAGADAVAMISELAHAPDIAAKTRSVLALLDD